MKNLKRILEVSSVVCSTVSITMVITCVYEGVPNILGFESKMIFDFAFSLLVASVVLGILAIAASGLKDRKLKIYFPTHRLLTAFSGFLTIIFCFKKKDLADFERFSKSSDIQPIINYKECINNLKEKSDNTEHLKSFDNLFVKNSKNECCLKSSAKSMVFSSSGNKSSEINVSPELQNFHAPCLFGRNCVKQNPTRLTESLKFAEFDFEQIGKKSRMEPHLKQTFITNGHLNEVNKRNISEKHPKIGIVTPLKINNSGDVENFHLFQKHSPSVETIHRSQKNLKERFNPKRVEQQSFYQFTREIPNVCFQEHSSNLYKSNPPIKTFRNIPNSQQELFHGRLCTTDLQNLPEVQHKVHRLRCRETSEKPYSDLLQTIPEHSDESFYEKSGIGKLNLHERQEINSGDHSYKLHRNINTNLKHFQYPLRIFKEAPHSNSRIISHYFEDGKNSEERGEHFLKRLDIPMEICEKATNDQVLEVSLKLNNLNFMF